MPNRECKSVLLGDGAEQADGEVDARHPELLFEGRKKIHVAGGAGEVADVGLAGAVGGFDYDCEQQPGGRAGDGDCRLDRARRGVCGGLGSQCSW